MMCARKRLGSVGSYLVDSGMYFYLLGEGNRLSTNFNPKKSERKLE
jgi:hypothetical protein